MHYRKLHYGSKDVYFQNLRISPFMATDWMKLRIVRWGGIQIMGAAQCNHKGPFQRDAGGVRGGDVETEAKLK